MNLSPLPIQKFFDNSGRPLDGGKLFTYTAGTSTKVATYTDDTGGTPNTNPIILDFRGECRVWIDPTLAYKFILSPSDDSDPPTSPIWTVDQITAAPLTSDNFAVDTGPANNIELSIPRLSTLAAFTRVVFKAANANTAAVTLQINGGLAKAITWQNLAALSGGEIQANGIYQVIYDGAQWQLQGPALGPLQIRTSDEVSGAITPSNYSPIPQNPVPVRYGAIGNGGADDTAAIAAASAANQDGLVMIDGGGRTYLVSSVLPASPLPVGFNYFNGRITCSQTVSDSLDGYSVTLFGYGAGIANTFIPEQHAAGGGIFYASGNHIVAIGRDALSGNTTGRRMTAVGSKALGANTTGPYNTGIGSHALQDNTVGEELTAVGVQCYQKNTTGDFNVGVGVSAGLLNQTGNLNTCIGHSAGRDSVSGDHNVCIGAQAGLSANGASDNVLIGYQAGSAVLVNSFNVGIGSAALGSATDATNNVAVGRRALAASTTADDNTAVGSDAAVAVTTATRIVAVGRLALAADQTGDNCTAVGHAALTACTGASNTAVGRAAGTAITSGTGNTYVGHQAGATETAGINNTAVGNLADSGTSGFSNSGAFGNGAASTGSNQITLGNASIGTLRCAVTVITAISDERYKKQIRPLELPDEFIEEVQIVMFEWNMAAFAARAKPDAIVDEMPGGTIVGVMAQQLDRLQKKHDVEWLGLVDKSNPDRWEATPGKLLLPLLEAHQRLVKRVTALERKK